MADSSTAANKVDTTFAATNMQAMTNAIKLATMSDAARSAYYCNRKAALLRSGEAARGSAEMVSAAAASDMIPGLIADVADLVACVISSAALVAAATALAMLLA